MRVGIGTDSRGRPQPIQSVVFRASAPFRAMAGNGRVVAQGQAGERWTVRAGKATAVLLSSDGARVGSFKGNLTLSMENPADNTIIVENIVFGKGFVWSGISDKELRGETTISLRKGRLVLSAKMPVEAYLYGVVGAEMPPAWPEEALKAQAVIARSYVAARAANHPHGRAGYDLCDGQHCQVYAGASNEADSVRRAVDATRGVRLLYNGKPAYAAYASNCGGFARSAKEAWGFGSAYLPGGPEDDDPPKGNWGFREWITASPPGLPCRGSLTVPACHHRWARVFTAEEIERAVRRRKYIGRLTRLQVLRRYPDGRVASLRIAGDRGVVTHNNDAAIRRYLGGSSLRSSLFVLEMEERGGRPVRVYVFGGGWGHGVGLCQGGSAGRAERGDPYDAILSHYFPGTNLSDGNSR